MRSFANLLLAFAAGATMLAAQPAPLQLLPPDADSIGGVDVRQTLMSPFGQFVLDQMKKEEPKLRDLIEATGFDPRTHLSTVVFAGAAGTKGKGVAIAQGIFNGPQILAAAKAKGAVITRYGKYDLALPPGEKGAGALAVVNGSMAVAGDEASVKLVLDRLSSGASAQNPLAADASTLAGKYHAWIISKGTRYLPNAGPGRQMGNIEGIEQVSGGVRFGSIVQLSGEALARSEKDAQALMGVFEFMKNWAQLNSGKQGPSPIEPLVQSLQAQAQGRIVYVTAQLAQDDLEKLMKPSPSHRRPRAKVETPVESRSALPR